MQYWLLKSEPFKYSWDTFIIDKTTFWDGVRNYQARNNLRNMLKGDLCFFYHSNEGLEIVGIAEVIRESYQDPTTTDPNWVVVDIKAKQKLKKAITLKQLKSDDRLSNMGLIKQSRLSVISLTNIEFNIIMELSENG